MNRTDIEWVKNPDGFPGYTWNPITGCLNGCPYCYARKLANGRLKSRYLANKNYPIYAISGMRIKLFTEPETDPFYPRFWEDRVREEFGAWTGGAEPKGIFVCDMSDLFGIGVPEEWTRRILNKIGMSYYKEHCFYLLTKQPQNLIKFSPFPENCWIGVTATDQGQYNQAIVNLRAVEAEIKYISFEPLLQKITILHPQILAEVDWVIIGAQTRPEKQPPAGAVDAILNAADIAGTPVFMKNNLAWQFHRREFPSISEVKV